MKGLESLFYKQSEQHKAMGDLTKLIERLAGAMKRIEGDMTDVKDRLVLRNKQLDGIDGKYESSDDPAYQQHKQQLENAIKALKVVFAALDQRLKESKQVVSRCKVALRQCEDSKKQQNKQSDVEIELQNLSDV